MQSCLYLKSAILSELSGQWVKLAKHRFAVMFRKAVNATDVTSAFLTDIY